jgi:hypothetical protein
MTLETRIGGNQVDVSLGPWPPGLVRSPLVRADVTRLEEPLHQNFTREDRRPKAGHEVLGEDGCELLRGADPNQTQVSILNRFVGEVLLDVKMLGAISTSNNGVGVAPLNASIVVIVDRCS